MSNRQNISQALALLRLRKAPRAVLSDYAATLLTHSESPDREDLVRLISLDPLMAVWILKRANGSYYGLRSTVDNLNRAIDVLEESAIVGMFADTFGAKRASVEDLPSSAPDKLTRHAVASALLSAQLSTGDLSDRGVAFTAGLLHDIGKHVFALNFPEDADKMYNGSSLWKSLQGNDLSTVEQLAFGLDHREVGEFVARKMYFPEILIDVLRVHAEPAQLPKSSPAYQIARIVNAASLAASALGYETGQPVSFDECRSNSCWDLLIQENLVEWTSKIELFADLESSVPVIDKFLDFEVNRSETLMKSDSLPKRKNREPIQNASQQSNVANSSGKPLES